MVILCLGICASLFHALFLQISFRKISPNTIEVKIKQYYDVQQGT